MSALGVSLVVLLVYTYLGYPLLVYGLARLLPRKARRCDSFEPSVSVCVAVSNGAAHLGRKLQSLVEQDWPPDKLEILVCADGCTDESSAIVRRFAATDGRIVLIDSPMRRGKPSALNFLVWAARGEVLVLTDSRQPLSQNAVRALAQELGDERVGCASGNLLLSGSSGAGAYWRYESLIRRAEGRMGRMVGVSGALYAVRRRDFPLLPPSLILDDMFVPLQIAAQGKQVVLAEDALAHDVALGDQRELERKVRTLAGNYQLFWLMPRLLLPGGHRLWLEMFSHKLLRLACPWALLGLLAISMLHAGSSLFWLALLGAQMAFYLLAASGELLGPAGRLARTFVVLNAAALAGLWRFAARSQPVTWNRTATPAAPEERYARSALGWPADATDAGLAVARARAQGGHSPPRAHRRDNG